MRVIQVKMMRYIVLLSYVYQTFAAPPRDMMMPQFKLDFYNIKTPQLIGIVAGTVVFTVTISVVIYLLYASGTLSRAWGEIVADAGKGSITVSLDKDKKKAITSPFIVQPELYDHLLEARKTLSKNLAISEISGKHIVVKKYSADRDSQHLFEASNGTPQYHESAYDLARIWGWEDVDIKDKVDSGAGLEKKRRPWESVEALKEFLADKEQSLNAVHLVIEEKEYKKPIGLVTLTRNDVSNLSINLGYRRVTAEVDERNIIARKFLQRCGFQLEAVLRKNKIVQNKNSNSALYSMLTAEWPDHEPKIRALANCKEEKKLKIAEVFTFDASPNSTQNGGNMEKGDEGQNVAIARSNDKGKKKKKN